MTGKAIQTPGEGQRMTTHLNLTRTMRDAIRSDEVRSIIKRKRSAKRKPRGRPKGWVPSLIPYAGRGGK